MDLKLKDEKFTEFISNHIKLTEPIETPHKLKKLNGNFDAYICGSDQIWTPMIFNPLYYLSFVDDKYKRISYAPSFGVSKIPNNKINKIAKLLDRFKSISVRESNGADIVKALIEKNAEVVLDPTFLMSQSEWDEIVPNIVHSQEEYLLCYFLSENEEYWRVASTIADKYNLKILVIPVTAESCRQPYELFIHRT